MESRAGLIAGRNGLSPLSLDRRRPALLVLGSLGLTGGILWLLLRDVPSSGGTVEPRSGETDSPQEEAERSPDRNWSEQWDREEPQEADPPSRVPVALEPTDESESWHIVGSLLGGLPPLSELRVAAWPEQTRFPISDRSTWGRIAEDFTYSIDVTELLGSWDLFAGQMEVGLFWNDAQIGSAVARAQRAEAVQPGEFLIRQDIATSTNTWIVGKIASDQEGWDPRRVRVGVLFRDRSTMRWYVDKQQALDHNRCFAIAYPVPVTRCYLAVIDGLHAPLARLVDLVGLGWNDLGVIHLAAGESIQGRLLLPDGDWRSSTQNGSPVPAGSVRAELLDSDCQMEWPGYDDSPLAWVGEGLAYRTKSTGWLYAEEFGLSGLGSFRYRLTQFPSEWSSAPGISRASVEIVAPAHGVRFDQVFTALVVTVHDDRTGEPLRVVQTEIHESEGDEPRIPCGRSTCDAGRARFLVKADTAYTIQIHAAGYPDTQLEVAPLFLGERREVTARLTRSTTPGSLRITLNGDAAAASLDLAIGLLDQVDPIEGPVTRQSAVHDGVAVFQNMPPGSHRVLLRPDGDWTWYQTMYVCEEIPVLIEEARETAVTVALTLGGKLRLCIEDEQGRKLPATCTVHDSAGTKLDVSFIARDDSRGILYRSDTIPHRGAVANEPDAFVQGGLPAGRYRVEARLEGFRSAEITVEIRKGEVTDGKLALVPE
ncbi:MAG: carboxypeptidase-like regulatory domain-containing protein [Candidatus Thermoplasmatota archaeon]